MSAAATSGCSIQWHKLKNLARAKVFKYLQKIFRDCWFGAYGGLAMSDRNCLTRVDLVKTLAAESSLGLTDKERCAAILEDYVELIKLGLQQDGQVKLMGFGSFEVREKKERRGLNPQNLQPIQLRPRRVVKFKASEKLRKALNS